MNRRNSGLGDTQCQKSTIQLKSIFLILAFLFSTSFVWGQLSISFPQVVEPSCNGFTDGSILAQVDGGAQPITLEWNTGATGLGLFGITGGTYTLTATDANNQTATETIVLGQPDAIDAGLTFLTSPCLGDPVDVESIPSGGVPPYTFAWGSGSTTSVETNLGIGTYFITITDATGCGTVESISIAEIMEIELTSVPPACPGGCDASASVAVTGGQMPYTFLWSNGATGSTNPNLLPGIQSVTVTDANGCTATGTVVIDDGTSDLALDIQSTNGFCNGTGSAEAIPSGGIPPYNFEWSTGAQTAFIDNLVAGTYTVTLTDAPGCEQIGTVVILSNNNLNVDVVVDYECGDPFGSATATASNGVPPYSYEWNDGQTGPTAVNLTPGETYKVTVTDQEECTVAKTILVADLDQLDVGINASLPSCDGFFDGTATAFVNGGSGNYTYLWDGGQQNPTIEFLGPGEYTVTISDENGCGGTASVTIFHPDPIEVEVITTDAICSDPNSGAAEAIVTGGTPPYTYMWNTYATGADQESPVLTGLEPGPYTIFVIDANECEGIAMFVIAQESDLDLSINGSDALCGQDVGSATVTAGAGTSPYSYAWNDAANQTTATATNLAAGTYEVTVTDADGCEDVAQITIGSTPDISCSINVNSPVTVPGGIDGSVTAQVSNGQAPYEYIWSNGQTGATISGLSSGTYSVTITDANGCTTECSVTLSEPARLGDYVWIDSNDNGIQDPSEMGVGGIEVILTGTTESGDNVTKTTTTNGDGFYIFDVIPGTYKVTFVIPSIYSFTVVNSGTNDEVDSDADPVTGMTDLVTVGSGEENLTLDAGINIICVNVSDPGEICCDQVLCGPGQDPDPIVSIELPSGGSGGPIEYLWMRTVTEGPFNPSFWEAIPDSNSPTYDPGPLAVTTYFARCARIENCGSFIETDIITIEVQDVAVASIITPPLPVCVDELVQFMAESNGPNATYSWNFGGGATPMTSTEQNPFVSWNSAAPRLVTLSVTNDGCTSTTDMNITVTMGPVFCGNGLVIDASNYGDYEAVVDWAMHDLNGDYDYQVESSPDGDDFELIGTVSDPSDYDPNEGLNKFKFIDQNPHPNISYYRVRFKDQYNNEYISNIDDVRFDDPIDDDINLYPTPFEDILTVELINYSDSNDMYAEIRGANGFYLRQENFEVDEFRKRIDMTHFPAGLYLIRIWKEGQPIETFKVVKINR